MNDIGAVGKDSVNEQQKFKFRGIDAVMNALSPALVKNKVFVVPEVLEQIREERQTQRGGNLIYSVCKIKYTFYAEDGSSVTATVIGEGMDSGDKSCNKAMSIAFKYACFQVFCIPTEEMTDPDAECHEVKPKKAEPTPEQTKEMEQIAETVITKLQLKALVDRLKKDGISEEFLKGAMKVDDLKNLTMKQYSYINEKWDKMKEMATK
jgi:hypothetical protein